MEGPGSAPHRVRNFFAGSIRRKLTLFVVLVSLLLIVLVWVFAVQMLEHAYNAAIKRELNATLDVFVQVLDECAEDDLPISSRYITPDGIAEMLSPHCLERLNEEIYAGNLSIENMCIDMSTSGLNNIFLHTHLPSQCALHKSEGKLGEAVDRDSTLAQDLRRRVFDEGTIEHRTEYQMVTGRLAAGGQLSVILSANVERIPQAVAILRQLMLGVSLLLLLVAAVCGLLFSRWFTKPLTRLSQATNEMAGGNYDVRVEEKGSDEIARLAHDFNRMAHEVKRSAELQRELFANVSHDLRTPLTLIKGFAETVRDLTGDEPEKRTEQLNIIVDETDRLSALVGNVLELSRVSSGVQRPNPIRFDLTMLCDEVADRYDAICQQNGYRCQFEGRQALEVLADPGLLERALHNLLGNALHHVGEDGFIGLSSFKTDHGTARVEVTDHGPGIPQKDLPHLFDRYYRSRQDAGKPGTGLGLSITKAIFVASGFAYGVNSVEGHGATFWFEAPLADEDK